MILDAFRGESNGKIMDTIRWLLINPQLIPPFLCFALGALLVMLTAIVYQLRTRQVVLFFSIRRIVDDFNKVEKRMLVIAAVLEVAAFSGMVIVDKFIGYKTL